MRFVITLACLLLTGCAATAGGPAADPPSTPGPWSVEPEPTAGPGRFTPMPPLPDHTGEPMTPSVLMLDAVRADLQERGVSPETMVVVSARSVVWRDGSWGCPVPGRSYTQALEPGAHLVVQVGQKQYDYRFGSGPQPRFCPPLVDR